MPHPSGTGKVIRARRRREVDEDGRRSESASNAAARSLCDQTRAVASRIVQNGEPDRIGRDAVDPQSLTLPSGDIAYLRIDHQARIQLDDGEIVIEGRFRVANADGRSWDLDPQDRVELGPFLSVYPGAVSQMSVDRDLRLVIVLAAGAVLTVPPDPAYEAWQIHGPGHRLVVSTPGGELTVFD